MCELLFVARPNSLYAFFRVKYLEIQCNGTGDSGEMLPKTVKNFPTFSETCEKYYSKMMSDCSGDSVCEGNVTLGKEKFCERPGRRGEGFRRLHSEDM